MYLNVLHMNGGGCVSGSTLSPPPGSRSILELVTMITCKPSLGFTVGKANVLRVEQRLTGYPTFFISGN